MVEMNISRSLTQSFGALNSLLPYLDDIEVLRLQVLSRFFYAVAISRV